MRRDSHCNTRNYFKKKCSVVWFSAVFGDRIGTAGNGVAQVETVKMSRETNLIKGGTAAFPSRGKIEKDLLFCRAKGGGHKAGQSLLMLRWTK